MSYEEKGTWVYLVTSAAAYAVYLVIILGRLASTPADHVPYVAALLWATGASVAASITGRILVETPGPATAGGPTRGTGTSTGSASTPAAGSWSRARQRR